MAIQLYGRETISDLPWKQMREGERIRDYLTALVREGTTPYIANVDTEVMVLTIDDLAIPLTINDREYQNSYICSPYAHYITLALEELRCVKSRLWRRLLKNVVMGLGVLFKWGSIDRVVSVNNWLIPTNLYLDITLEQAQEITTFLKRKFPSHTIQFRSLNRFSNKPLMQNLEKLSYKMVLSRQVYMVDGAEPRFFSANMFKKDLALVKRSPYQPQPRTSHEAEQIAAHYRKIYLDKYTLHNPQFTPNWVELISKSDCWTLRVLQHEKHVHGAYAYLKIGSSMTMPFFGYDPSLPQELGLYRIISTLVATDAAKDKAILNQSAGAAAFKRLRRAVPQLEYSAVYHAHLPLRRKLPWKVLRVIFNRAGGFLLDKFGM